MHSCQFSSKYRYVMNLCENGLYGAGLLTHTSMSMCNVDCLFSTKRSHIRQLNYQHITEYVVVWLVFINRGCYIFNMYNTCIVMYRPSYKLLT